MKIITIILIFFIKIGFAQTTPNMQLLSTSGDRFNSTNYQLDWSIGECVTATHKTDSYVITQGFHQDTYIITLVKDLAKNTDISVFPNPTSDMLTVRCDNCKNNSSILTVTDTQGKIIRQKIITSKDEHINLSGYADGIYFLSVKQQNELIKTFNIIKN